MILGRSPRKAQITRRISGAFTALLLVGGIAGLTACLDPDTDPAASAETSPSETPGDALGEVVAEEEPSPSATPSEAATTAPVPLAAESGATLRSVVDGDTVKTSAGTVRIIGIDTPERGECGYKDAARLIRGHIASGDPIVLELPAGQNDTDRHGRLLRTVKTSDGIDIGRAQLEAGNAVARYDSRDGYPSHPDEKLYRSLSKATLTADGRVVTTGCAAAGAKPTPKPTTKPVQPATGSTEWESGAWYTQYRSCAALKRNPGGNPTGPFNRDIAAETPIYNWFQYGTGYRGDGDGDGLACE